MHYFESSAKSSKIENVHEVFKSSIDWALAYRDEKTEELSVPSPNPFYSNQSPATQSFEVTKEKHVKLKSARKNKKGGCCWRKHQQKTKDSLPH